MKDNLNDLLKSWQPEIPEPSDFRRRVWQKIELSSPTGAAAWLTEWLMLLARPQIAFVTIVLAIVVGGTIGFKISASHQTSDYLHSVNPYSQLR